MSEQVLRFSSKNRQRVGISESHDFTTRFNEPIKLSHNKKHEIAVRTLSMTYSWYNIRASYNNNKIKYSRDGGTTWKTITFVDGMYSYDDIDDFIKRAMRDEGDTITKSDNNNKIVYAISMTFILSSYRVLIELKGNYKIDFQDGEFRKLIGFESKIIDKTDYGTLLPNITRGVDEVHINCDKVTDSIVDGQSSSTVAVIPVENLVRSLPFNYKPRFLAYSPVLGHLISTMRFYVTDSSGNPIDLNGIDWYIELFLRSTAE